MMAPTHLAAGAAAGLAVSLLAGQPALIGIVLGAAGGLIPDIDHPNGKLRRNLPGSNILLFWLSHRGITHTLAALLIVGALAPFPFMVGYASHLMVDTITIRGIPLFWPLSARNISLLPIRSGGWIENLVIMPGLFMLIAFMLVGGR